MTGIVNFLLDNWRMIVEIIILVVSLVVWLIKKKPNINEIDNILLKVFEKLPEWINSAETLKGAEVKKTLVMESVKKFIKEQFSVILPDSYINMIGCYVESILSTPQKHDER